MATMVQIVPQFNFNIPSWVFTLFTYSLELCYSFGQNDMLVKERKTFTIKNLPRGAGRFLSIHNSEFIIHNYG